MSMTCGSCVAPYQKHPKFAIAVERLGAENARFMADNGEFDHPLAAAQRRDRPVDPSASDGVQLTSAAAIQPVAVDWLLRGRLALACLALLVGRAGLGKTTVATEVAARVTRGQLGRPPADVVIASAEDSIAHTLVPRLVAAGADLSRVHFISMRRDGVEEGLVLPDDIAALEDAVPKVGAELVVIDPVAAHLSGRVDSHRDASVRGALGPLARVADRTGAAILAIGHLNKGAGLDVLDRIGGSVGFGAAARNVLLLAADPDTDPADGFRILAHAKSNLSPLAVALRLCIEGRVIEDDIATSGVAWLGDAPGVAPSQLLQAVDDEKRVAVSEASEWLKDALEGGPQPRAELLKQALADGIAERTLQRARKRVGAVVERDEHKQGRPAKWRLPGNKDIAYMPTGAGMKPVARNESPTRQEESDEIAGFVPNSRDGTKPLLTCLRCGQPNSSDAKVHPACDPSIATATATEGEANVIAMLGAEVVREPPSWLQPREGDSPPPPPSPTETLPEQADDHAEEGAT